MTEKKRANDDEGSAPPKRTKLENAVAAILGAETEEDVIMCALEACPASTHVALSVFKKAQGLKKLHKAGSKLIAAFAEHCDTSAEHCSEGMDALCCIEVWDADEAKKALEAAVEATQENEGCSKGLARLTSRVLAAGGDVADVVADALDEVEADPESVVSIAKAIVQAGEFSENLVTAVARAARTHSLSNREALEACAEALEVASKKENLAEAIEKTKIVKVFQRAGLAAWI